MAKINPEISQLFLKEIRSQSATTLDIEGIRIKTCPNVFPPQSSFSQSSERLNELFSNIRDKRILDMGTGTGFQAIQAAKQGAAMVIAVDINPQAVQCAIENAALNDVSHKVSVLESDLFEKISPNDRFDVIIANLPIVDFPVEGIVESALYDPDFQIHKRFLAAAKQYLYADGYIVMTHINFKGPTDFAEFEQLLNSNDYHVAHYLDIENMGFTWRLYRIKIST